MYGQDSRPVKFKPVSEFPAISRDISLSVPTTINASDIEQSMRKSAAGNGDVKLSSVKFTELYEGDKIAKDRRGLIFSLTYESSKSKTLRDEEAENLHSKVCRALIEDLGVEQR